MKHGDWLILQELQKIEKMLVVQNEKIDELSSKKHLFVIPELERAIKNVSMLADSIDRKVPDKG
jgi:hypothetical protein